MTGFTPQLARRVFFDRDGERCFRCRMPLRWHERGFAWSMHHRKPRGMGSSTAPEINSAPNALTLCGHATTPNGCHRWAETHRTDALEQGYLIPTNATTETFAPAAVRVRRLDGSWWLLTEAGRAVEVEEGMPQ